MEGEGGSEGEGARREGGREGGGGGSQGGREGEGAGREGKSDIYTQPKEKVRGEDLVQRDKTQLECYRLSTMVASAWTLTCGGW